MKYTQTVQSMAFCFHFVLDFTFSNFCLSDCDAGYIKNEQSGECEDIDECESGDATCDMSSQVCYNTLGECFGHFTLDLIHLKIFVFRFHRQLQMFGHYTVTISVF